jgi:hypothetical protein
LGRRAPVVVELELEVEVEVEPVLVPEAAVGELETVVLEVGASADEEVEVAVGVPGLAVEEAEVAADAVELVPSEEPESVVVSVALAVLVDPVSDSVRSEAGSHESVSETMTPAMGGRESADSGVPPAASNENWYFTPPRTSIVTTQVSAEAAGRVAIPIVTRTSTAAATAEITLRRLVTDELLLQPESS